MTLPARGAALAAGVVLCAAVTAACGTDRDPGGGGRQPSGIAVTATVAPDPAATDLTDLTRILDRAESAAAAAESDGADDD
ncbi:hypothetical protein [Streptomyces sp. HUAS ZL42]|uniref:hypothetical protein n=1 Tax=Streptomyces sp. HUAS ZL42 TaxID=3231715 RepID=UPI00345E0DAA